ncbi:MAG: DUF1566 domain-containing protein [Deltaproteobacteria bacterium]|jgi:hypothetical protein|nr:DUF1566 domain-containing protein [Deltaproteobacteria bacterium]
MKKQRESTLVLALFVAFVFSMAVILPGTAMAGPPAFVEKTGQTVSYAVGDDGEYQAGVDLPSPRFTDNGDGTVTDNLTRLIWLKNANCFGGRTWYEALSDANQLADESCDLTDGSVPGDWRLPNVKEMMSLIHYGYGFPSLSNAEGTGQWSEGNAFSRVMDDDYYWSSTTDALEPGIAYVPHFSRGLVRRSYKATNVRYVWPVRGGRTFDSIDTIE